MLLQAVVLPLGSNCLCLFDLDRTLTSKRGATATCPGISVQTSISMSSAASRLRYTFCVDCFLGILTEGEGGGSESMTRSVVHQFLDRSPLLGFGGAWNGDRSSWSVLDTASEPATSTTASSAALTSRRKLSNPAVMYLDPGNKILAVGPIVELFRERIQVHIADSDVWFFDDQAVNIAPFSALNRYNARQVSCASRDPFLPTGYCGATPEEIVRERGVHLCASPPPPPPPPPSLLSQTTLFAPSEPSAPLSSPHWPLIRAASPRPPISRSGPPATRTHLNAHNDGTLNSERSASSAFLGVAAAAFIFGAAFVCFGGCGVRARHGATISTSDEANSHTGSYQGRSVHSTRHRSSESSDSTVSLSDQEDDCVDTKWELQLLEVLPQSDPKTVGRALPGESARFFTVAKRVDLCSGASVDLGRHSLCLDDRKVSRTQVRVEAGRRDVSVCAVGANASALQSASGHVAQLRAFAEHSVVPHDNLLWLVCEREGELHAPHAMHGGFALRHALRLVKKPAAPAAGDAEARQGASERGSVASRTHLAGHGAVQDGGHTADRQCSPGLGAGFWRLLQSPFACVSTVGASLRAHSAEGVGGDEDDDRGDTVCSSHRLVWASSGRRAMVALEAEGRVWWRALRVQTAQRRRAAVAVWAGLGLCAVGAALFLCSLAPVATLLRRASSALVALLACTALAAAIVVLKRQPVPSWRRSEVLRPANIAEAQHASPGPAGSHPSSPSSRPCANVDSQMDSSAPARFECPVLPRFECPRFFALFSSSSAAAAKSAAPSRTPDETQGAAHTREAGEGPLLQLHARDTGDNFSSHGKAAVVHSEDGGEVSEMKGSVASVPKVSCAWRSLCMYGARSADETSDGRSRVDEKLRGRLRRALLSALLVGALVALMLRNGKGSQAAPFPAGEEPLDSDKVTGTWNTYASSAGGDSLRAPPSASAGADRSSSENSYAGHSHSSSWLGETAGHTDSGENAREGIDSAADTKDANGLSDANRSSNEWHRNRSSIQLPWKPGQPPTQQPPTSAGVQPAALAEATADGGASNSSFEESDAHVVASFFAVGDWGYDAELHAFHCTHERERCVLRPGCQRALADAMRAEAKRRGNVAFVLNVGDSFYPGGVHGTTDPQWTEKWADVYQGMPPMPWYSVYGNHDLEATEWRCACLDNSRHCHQVKKHGVRHGNLSWFMPSASYYSRPIAGLPLEIVALDLNAADVSKICPWVAQAQQCSAAECGDVLARREAHAANLLVERVHANKGGNLLVIAHYPTDFLRGRRPAGVDLLETLRTSETKITYFGGHRHATGSFESGAARSESIAPNSNWLVGGGGGWACDGSQGFAVGEILSNGKVVNMQPVMADDSQCCAAKEALAPRG